MTNDKENYVKDEGGYRAVAPNSANKWLGMIFVLMVSYVFVSLVVPQPTLREAQAAFFRGVGTITTLTSTTLASTTITNSGAATFNGTVALGDAVADTITGTGHAAFTHTVALGDAVADTITANGHTDFTHTVTLGDAVADTITINGATTITAASLTGDATSSADWSGAVAVAIPVKSDCGTSCTSGSLCIDTTEDQLQACNSGSFALVIDFSP